MFPSCVYVISNSTEMKRTSILLISIVFLGRASVLSKLAITVVVILNSVAHLTTVACNCHQILDVIYKGLLRSHIWWCTPVIPETGEAETGGLYIYIQSGLHNETFSNNNTVNRNNNNKDRVAEALETVASGKEDVLSSTSQIMSRNTLKLYAFLYSDLNSVCYLPLGFMEILEI